MAVPPSRPSSSPMAAKMKSLSTTGTRSGLHFTSDTSRIFAHSGTEGLVSFRWDGTDIKQHIRVTGTPGPTIGTTDFHGEGTIVDSIPMEGAQGPPPASVVLMAPKGDLAVVRAGTDIYTVIVPVVGGPVTTVGVSGGAVPVKKLTEIGGEFPSWGADGRTVHWAIGNAFITYNLDRAKAVEDSLKAVERAKADSTRRAGARADTLKTLGARVDSLTKANAAVPDSLKTRLDFFKADSARTDSVKKATDKAKADSTKLATARTDSLKKLNARVDSLRRRARRCPTR